MKIIRSPEKMSDICRRLKCRGRSLGFVPTMGALHEGHLSLVKRARRECDIVIVSIFVNPAQFGPGEDFARYPRNIEADARFCRQEGVEYLFYPSRERMYPAGYRTFVTVEGLSGLLCGAFRPGHFRGVTTVVARLFQIIRPDAAYFGRKDAQQALIIRRMVKDLNMPVRIKVMPIVRDRQGMALSSRNRYLSPAEKEAALSISRGLRRAAHRAARGMSDGSRIVKETASFIRRAHPAKIDYVALVDPETLAPVKKLEGAALLAVAAWFGRTRLIDNIVLRKKRWPSKKRR